MVWWHVLVLLEYNEERYDRDDVTYFKEHPGKAPPDFNVLPKPKQTSPKKNDYSHLYNEKRYRELMDEEPPRTTDEDIEDIKVRNENKIQANIAHIKKEIGRVRGFEAKSAKLQDYLNRLGREIEKNKDQREFKMAHFMQCLFDRVCDAFEQYLPVDDEDGSEDDFNGSRARRMMYVSFMIDVC